MATFIRRPEFRAVEAEAREKERRRAARIARQKKYGPAGKKIAVAIESPRL